MRIASVIALALWACAASVAADLPPHKATSTNEWIARRAVILRQMQSVMGPLPRADKRSPLNVQVLSEMLPGKAAG